MGHSGVKIQPEPIEKTLEEDARVATAVLVGIEGGRQLGVALRQAHVLTESEQTALEAAARTIAGQMAPSFKDHLRIAFSDEDFSAENGLLTRNLKINRSAVQTRFFATTAPA